MAKLPVGVRLQKTLYFADGVRRIDYVLAVEDRSDEFAELRDYFEDQLKATGLQLEKEAPEVGSDEWRRGAAPPSCGQVGRFGRGRAFAFAFPNRTYVALGNRFAHLGARPVDLLDAS